ncbi:MAG TPA: GreA/GreB family elongation factor [Allosphingosinicella sp.]|nr:GreA/GreB family elongation factor [Allosphingosinicella sp.]
MSVAFRRDSDEEHKEPRFERPIPVGPNLVTAAGLAQAEARVAALIAEVEAERDEARLAEAQRALRYWRTRLATAELAPPPPEGEAGFGSRVTFRLNGRERTIDIIGDDEADPAAGRIAFSAPLARALIGAGPGDFSDFAGKPDAIEIVVVGAIDS